MNKSIAATILMVLISTITVAQNDSALVNRIDQYLIASEQNGYSGKFKTAQKDKTRANWAPQPGVIINSVVSAIIGGLAVYFMTGC